MVALGGSIARGCLHNDGPLLQVSLVTYRLSRWHEQKTTTQQMGASTLNPTHEHCNKMATNLLLLLRGQGRVESCFKISDPIITFYTSIYYIQILRYKALVRSSVLFTNSHCVWWHIWWLMSCSDASPPANFHERLTLLFCAVPY